MSAPPVMTVFWSRNWLHQIVSWLAAIRRSHSPVSMSHTGDTTGRVCEPQRLKRQKWLEIDVRRMKVSVELLTTLLPMASSPQIAL
jgi:hypothetical protein